jgi:chitodextrinase/predicted esterase
MQLAPRLFIVNSNYLIFKHPRTFSFFPNPSVMKRNLFLSTLIMMLAAGVYAQPNIFNPNDSVFNYNSAKPPVIPAANTMAKWVRTTTRITNWNTNKFKPYFWNGMAFRLRFPNGYNPADTTKKYPVILFLHGAGEIKGIYDDEDHLYWGAQPFQAKIDSGRFNAFLLFPQVSATAWDYTYYTRINSVLDSMQKYVNSDPDKLIVMGLSNGAFGAMSYAANFPTRVSTIIASSPALIQLIQGTIDNVIHIPTWLASGGLDTSPGPDVLNNYVNEFSSKGGNIKYSFYPDLPHNTWERMWTDPNLVPYWTNAHTANPLIFFQKTQYCVNGVTAKMGLSMGFAEYQWQVNGTDIPNSNSNEITGTQLGSYRARFRRVAGGPWSDWSTVPAVITALPATASPSIIITGVKSNVLPATDGSTTTPLELPTGYTSYEWRNASDSSLLSTNRTFAAPAGQYIAKATSCNSTFTPIFTIISATGSPKPDSARDLTLARASSSSIKLTWTDVANPVSNETGFEIYRAANAGGPYTLAAITAADVKTYTDTSIANNYNFYYIIRAVNATGAAGVSNEASLQPASDSTAPTVPVSLKAIFTSRNYIDLEWGASADSVGVTAYDVYVNGTKKYTTTVPKISADSLTPGVAYTFTVVARDQAGNVSAVSNATTATSKLNGLKYHYYEGSWSLLPDFSTLTAVASAQIPNTDLTVRPTGVVQNYGFVWEGFINIRTPGSYTFETVSDDGSKFYYNTFYSPSATPLVNNDGLHGAISATGTVNITDTGLHPIAITFFQQSSGQSLDVYWTGPGIARQLIPNSAFTETFTAATDTVKPTTPANFKSTFTSRNYIDLTWDYSTDNVGVVGYDVYVNGTKKYTTLTNTITADSLSPNVAYTFTVKARDFAGNNSVAGTLTITTAATALKYKYYEGNWSMLPDFSTLTPVKTGSTPNVDITVRPTGVIQNYAFVWEGYINIKTPGNYTFETISDDGSKFYYNSFYSPAATALISNDGVHGPTTVTGTVNITDTGMHPVAITFFQQSSGQSMQVYWTGPGIARQLIPDSAFTQAFKLPTDVTAPTTPTTLKAVFLSNTSIDLTWTASTDNIGVVAYDVYVGGVKKYTTLTNSLSADSLTANTTYVFTVKARDLPGNTSAASTAVSAKTTASAAGLKYSFYQGNWDVLPDFTTLTAVKTGTSANVDITVKPTTVVNYYGFVWQGYINIPAAGIYTFETVSDDGSKLYFNSTYVPTTTATVTNDGLHGATTVTGTVSISTAGYYPISITYFQKDGGQSMQVYWSSASITRALIPSSAFVYQLPADNVAPSVPANVTASAINSTFINLTWTASTDNVGVTGYDVYVNGTKKYTSLTNSIIADSLTAGTPYVFTVKARDFAGNISAFSTAFTTATSATTTGLTYKYYEGNWDVLPNFNALTPVKTGYTPNVDIITTRNVDDYFGYVWEGSISLPTAGTYTFETISDDGSKIYFNQKYSPTATALVNNDGVHGPIAATGSVTVAAGAYPIAITFFEKNSGETMQVYWSGPGIPRQLIPNAAFTGAFVLPKDSVAPSVPANVKAILTTNTFVDIAWDASTDNIGVIGYDVYVNGVKKTTVTNTNYRLTGVAAGETDTVIIKAVDLANNMSAFSTAIAVVSAPKANGLKYRYYEGNWNVMPNFDTLAVVKTGSGATTDISVRPATVNYYYGFVWEGYINITTPGIYTFETVSDDGSKFYWNTLYNAAATPLVNNDGIHPAISVTGTVNITTAGLYPISVTFFQKEGGGSMQLFYSGPGISRQLLTGASLNLSADAATNGIVSSLSTINATNDAAINAKVTNAYPNPFTENLTVQYSNTTAVNNVSVGVYDMNGRLVQRQMFGNLSAGTNTLNVNLDKQMIPGMYLVRLDIDGKPLKLWKMIKQKK